MNGEKAPSLQAPKEMAWDAEIGGQAETLSTSSGCDTKPDLHQALDEDAQKNGFGTQSLLDDLEPWGNPVPFGAMSETPKPWQWNVIPKTIATMGKEIAKTFNVPDEMAGTAVLGAASIACGKRARVFIKPDHVQFANLFFLVAAPVAAGKTPITKAATAPLIRWQMDQKIQFDNIEKAWRVENTINENIRKGLEKELQSPRPKKSQEEIRTQLQALEEERKEPPVEPRLFCEDFTSEILGQKMDENDGFMGVISGEGRRVLEIAKGRYSSEGDMNLWLKGHGGDYCRVDRKNGGCYEIEEACLSSMIMTQPDSLRMMGDSEAMRENGFLARWLYIIPEPRSGNYPTESISQSVKNEYEGVLKSLIESESVDVKFDAAALKTWTEFHDQVSARTVGSDGHRDGLFVQWLSKQPEHVARIALLFHHINTIAGESGTLKNEVENAIKLFHCFESHAKRAVHLIGADSEVVIARRVWEWIDRHREEIRQRRFNECNEDLEAVKPRDLQQAGISGIKKVSDATVAINRLVENGYLQEAAINPTGKKKQKIFILRPRDV